MFDFTHKKRPDLIQLVLIIAVVCLALGAITPAASAVAYDWEFSVEGSSASAYTIPYSGYDLGRMPAPAGYPLQEFAISTDTKPDVFQIQVLGTDTSAPNWEQSIRQFFYDLGFIDSLNASINFVGIYPTSCIARVTPPSYPFTFIVPASTYPFYIDVVDSGNDYLISVSGIDGSQLAGSAYTIAVSTYSGGYNLPLTSFPMYLGDSPVHLWTTDQTFTLPIYLSGGVTSIDYYCMMSFPADPTATGYPFWWNMTTHGSSEYPFNTTYPPVVIPTPIIPSDIIPHPDYLNNTVNITGWYQEQGYEGNNITAPIYSGIRGWFNENLVPVIDFFLIPTNYVATVISDSAETSTDGISYITEELGSYAAPFNTVGAYVVRLVPEVVWLVVFAALSIGYVVLLIRISTGSIKDTIGRFLGGSK